MAEASHRARDDGSHDESWSRRADAGAAATEQNAAQAPALSLPPQPERRRAKALLKNYYGLEGAGGFGGVPDDDVAKSVPRVADPMDVDSSSFDLDRCFQKVLREKSLGGLIQKDADLRSEISQLDGEMKTLVYENYSKFISATDTIRRMKSNVENMETEMARLTSNIDVITKSSSALNEAFGEKRHKIRQLSGVHNLLKKLQFIFELPNRLTECLRTGLYGQAVRYYARAAKLLAHYRHLSVFRTIEDECRCIMKFMGGEVKSRIQQEDATPAEVSEYAGWLLGLGEEPVEQIWKEYITIALRQFGKLRANVVSRISQLEVMPPAIGKQTEIPTSTSTAEENSSPSPKAPSFPVTAAAEDAVSHLNTAFLAEVAKFLACFRDYFLAEQAPTSASPSTAGTVPISAPKAGSPGSAAAGERQRPVVDRAFIVILTPEQRESARRDLYEAIEGLMKDYFDVVEGFLQLPADPMSLNVAVPAYVFNKIMLDMAAYGVLTSMARLPDRLRKCARSWVRQLMRTAFDSVRNRLLERMSVFSTEVSAKSNGSTKHVDIFGFLHEMEVWLHDQLSKRCLNFLESFMQPQHLVMRWPNGTEEYLSYVQSGLRDFWDMGLQSMMDYVNPPRAVHSFADDDVSPSLFPPGKKPVLPVASIVLACMARRCAQHVAPAVYELFSDRMFGTGRRKVKEHIAGMGQYAVYGNGPTGGAELDHRSKQRREEEMGGLFPDGREVAAACREKAQCLLNLYVELLGQDISVKIRYNIESTNWFAAREPRGVSRVWEQVLSALAEIENDVIAACGDEEIDGHVGGDQSSEGSRRPPSHLGGNTSPHGTIRMYHKSPSFSGSNHRISQLGTGARPSLTGSIISYDRNLLSRIDRLFSERLEIFGTVPFNTPGILTGIIKIIIKAMTEIIRLQTFSRNGFQQVQINVEFLRVHLWKFLNDDRMLNSMLEDVLTSAHRRCTDPAQLDVNVIEKTIATFSDD